MRPIQFQLRRWTIFTALVFSFSLPTTAAESESTTRAKSLLQGVANQRLSLQNIDAEVEVIHTRPDSNEIALKKHFRIQQAGLRRRCENFDDSAEPSVYLTDLKANTVYGFIRSAHNNSLNIYSVEYAHHRRGIFEFDFRTFGMTSSPGPLTTVEQCLLLPEQDGTVDLLDPITESGVRIERVRYSNGGYSAPYWIAQPHFRLIRRSITFLAGSDSTVHAEYDANVAGGILPTVVVVQDRQPGNSFDRTATLLKVDTSAEIDDETFSIASMNLPVNTVVNDYRTNKIAGYWTGDRIELKPRSEVKPVEHNGRKAQ